MTPSRITLLLASTALLLAGCGGAIDANIGGAVSGLSGGTSVALLNNGTNLTTVNANGNFTFSTQIQAGNTYDVTVSTQPIGETCSVTNATGTVSQNSGDVTNVAVVCDATVTASNDVLGVVSGLASGGTLKLLDTINSSGTDPESVTANGQFVFPTALSTGSKYSVTVVTNPTGQTCTVTNGTGVIPSTGTITAVIITCQ